MPHPGVGKVVKLLADKDIMKLTKSAGKMNFQAWNHESEHGKVLLDIFCPVECSEDYLKLMVRFYDSFLADELKIVGGVRIAKNRGKREDEIKDLKKKLEKKEDELAKSKNELILLEKKQVEKIEMYRENVYGNKQIIKDLRKEINELKKEKLKIDLKFFEGIWRDITVESRYYAQSANGRLFLPYCYGDRSSINAHDYNCILADETLFARFEWFDHSHSGYTFYNVESKDRLAGGWWYDHDVPDEIRRDISKLNDSIPKMKEIILERETGSIMTLRLLL